MNCDIISFVEGVRAFYFAYKKPLFTVRSAPRQGKANVNGGSLFGDYMICSQCKQDKNIENFYKQSKKNYYRSICKECYSKNNKKYHSENYEDIKETQRAWYSKNKKSIFSYISDWRNSNKEKVKQYEKKSRQNHAAEKITWTQNRRAKIRGSQGSFTQKEWKDLLDKYDNKCLCCGRSDIKLTQDHVMPIKLGGSNTIDNIQPLCKSCNSRKNAKYIDYRKGES